MGGGFVSIFKYILYCPQQVGAAKQSNIFLYLAKTIKILSKIKPQKAYLKLTPLLPRCCTRVIMKLQKENLDSLN